MKRRWHGDPFKILPDDTAALRRCCRAFAHTVDQGGSEQVGAVGNWIGGGPAHRLVVLGPYAQILLFQPFLAIVCCCTSRLVPSTQFTFTKAVSRITRVSGSKDPLPIPSMFPPYDRGC